MTWAVRKATSVPSEDQAQPAQERVRQLLCLCSELVVSRHIPELRSLIFKEIDRFGSSQQPTAEMMNTNSS
jgi:hypothetical protein